MGLSRIRHAGHRTCRIPSHDLPGLESSRKTLVPRPLVLIGSTNVSTLSIGRPKLYPIPCWTFCGRDFVIQLSCWRFFTQHSAWKSGTLRQGPFTYSGTGPFISASTWQLLLLRHECAVRKSVFVGSSRARL